MSPHSPEEAKAIAAFLINDFENELQTTERVLDAVPAGRLDYRPDEKSKSSLELLRHITIEDEWFLNSIAGGAFTAAADESDACGIMTPSDAVTCYKQRISVALNKVRSLSGEELTSTIDFFGIFQAPRLNVLGLALKHSVHHRGQLSTYLRAAGGKVPGIYGPSADTMQPAAS